MPRDATIYRVLIASPSDVCEEREAARNIIYEWNASHSIDMSIMLEPVLWETYVHPELGDRPQSIINKQIVSDADVLVGMFWTKVGTSTGAFESGTIEEIEQFIESQKPAMIYFSNREVQLDQVDLSQYYKLREFKERSKSSGVISTYKDVPEFKLKLIRDISKIAFKLRQFGINGEESFSQKNKQTASNYVYEIDKNRLRVQADLLYDLDVKSIEKAISYIRRSNPMKTIKILDLGCADGYVTYTRFSKLDNVQVEGIDISKNAIEEANRDYASEKLKFSVANIEDVRYHPEGYDLIYCALVLHHLENPEGVMHRLWSFLNPNGCLIVRGSDDGTKLNYPQNDDLDFLLQSTNQINGSSDRQYGRKIYTHMTSLEPEPTNIEMDFKVDTTVNMGVDERSNYYFSCYSFRAKYANSLTNNPNTTGTNIKTTKKLQKIIEDQKDRFVNEKRLFFMNVQNIAIAYKP